MLLQHKEETRMSTRYFDIFAGIVGFFSGLDVAGGFECVGYYEINRYVKQAYETFIIMIKFHIFVLKKSCFSEILC